MEDRVLRKPLTTSQLPECYSNFEYDECCLCFVVTECMHRTTGKSHRQIIHMWNDLEKIKKEIYPELVQRGYIHPSNKLEHIPMMSVLKALIKLASKK